MIQINPRNLNEIISYHTLYVENYINYSALHDREKRYIKNNIEDILSINPNNFESIIEKIKVQNIDNNRLKKAFIGGSKYGGYIGYSKFSSKNTKPYNAYDLAEKLKITTCSYCNINSTYTVVKNRKKITRPTFDHFYDKATYPILALSFYNLIPSCHICNSSLKGSTKFSIKTHLNPYSDSFNSLAKFQLEVKDSSFFYDEKGFKIELKTEDERAKNHIVSFELEALYENHKDTVLELIQKREIYPDSYIDELYQNYSFFNNREDVLQLITGGYVEDKDLGKRPLSKLIKDISEELELI